MNVSIVIPVYNEAEYLDACLRAISKQTVKPYEVIIIDNNSTDASDVVAARYPFVKLLQAKHQGIVHARNRGFNAARGDIIARIDADSLVPANWVQTITQFYSQGGSTAFALTGGANFVGVPASSAVSWLYSLLAFDFNRLLIGHETLWGSNMAITRQQWHSVRTKACRVNGLHEDLDLAMHLHDEGYRIFYDRHFRVQAHLRRVETSRRDLWDYLQWWPRTLRYHGKRSWPICWLFGALMLYIITPLLHIGSLAGRVWSGLVISRSSGVRLVAAILGGLWLALAP